MKKPTAILMTALIGLLGFGASAQTQDNKTCQRECPVQTAGDMNKMRQPREFTEFAFEGILLDIDQQTRIDSLNEAVKAKAQQYKQCQKGKCGKCTSECTSPENCPNKDNCKMTNSSKDKKEGKKGNCAMKGKNGKSGMRPQAPMPYGPEYIEKVKEILTPEQYTVFLENIVQCQPNRPNGMRGHGPKADGQRKGQNPNGQKMPKSAKGQAAKAKK